MILQICSVYDAAIASYGRPFFVPGVGAAVRSFSDEVNYPKDQNMLYHHPEDFELYHLGSFDDEHGRFDIFSDPIRLGRGQDYKNVSPSGD